MTRPLDAANKISKRFCAADADMILRSCDGTLFKVFKKNLESHSDAFAAEGMISSPEEVVDLTETAATLELLFQFMSPQPQPVLSAIHFSILDLLAEAAEKYQVFSAMQLCQIHMKKALHGDRAAQILNYAIKHNYEDIMDEAALTLLREPLKDTLKILHIGNIAAWTRFHAEWLDVLHAAHKFLEFRCSNCEVWQVLIARRLGGKVSSLLDVEKVFAPIGETKLVEFKCRCNANFKEWYKTTAKGVKDIPKFSIFL